MKNKKGFTLIELLAVIIILAIIAVIATPIILNIVEKARKSAAEDAAYGVLEAAKTYYTESLLDEIPKSLPLPFFSLNDIKVSGTKPDYIEFELGENGQFMEGGTIVISGYTCTITIDQKIDCEKGVDVNI